MKINKTKLNIIIRIKYVIIFFLFGLPLFLLAGTEKTDTTKNKGKIPPKNQNKKEQVAPPSSKQVENPKPVEPSILISNKPILNSNEDLKPKDSKDKEAKNIPVKEKEKTGSPKPALDKKIVKKSEEKEDKVVEPKRDSLDFAIEQYEQIEAESDDYDNKINELIKGLIADSLEQKKLIRFERITKEEQSPKDSLNSPKNKRDNKKPKNGRENNGKAVASTNKMDGVNPLDSVHNRMELLKKVIEEKNKEKSELLVSRDKYIPKIAKKAEAVQVLSAKFSGPRIIKYKNQKYYFFVANPDSDQINLHWKSPKGRKYIAMENLKNQLDMQKTPPLMMCNAGMYNMDNSPKGLFIENSKELIPMDNDDPKNGDNFYLMPNGVFYLDKDGSAHIDTSVAFNQKREAKKIAPIIATQSGPMLVYGGKVNKVFTKGSKNYNIRNGVGIMPNGKVAFCISVSRVNFYDMSNIYKDFFGCKEALFLDGAISRMYLKTLNPKEVGGGFGPIFSVTKKSSPKK